jgi:hypothetical protein
MAQMTRRPLRSHAADNEMRAPAFMAWGCALPWGGSARGGNDCRRTRAD